MNAADHGRPCRSASCGRTIETCPSVAAAPMPVRRTTCRAFANTFGRKDQGSAGGHAEAILSGSARSLTSGRHVTPSASATVTSSASSTRHRRRRMPFMNAALCKPVGRQVDRLRFKHRIVRQLARPRPVQTAHPSLAAPARTGLLTVVAGRSAARVADGRHVFGWRPRAASPRGRGTKDRAGAVGVLPDSSDGRAPPIGEPHRSQNL